MELTSGLKLVIHKQGEQKDHQLALFVCIYLVMNSLNSMVQTTFGVSGSTLTIIRIAIYAVLIVSLIAGLLTLSKGEFSVFVCCEVIAGITYLFSMLYGGGTQTTEWLIETIGIYLPLAFFAWAVNDKEILYRDLMSSSWIIFVIMLIYSTKITTYNMHFGYSILLIILLHLNEAIAGKRKYFIPVIVELVLLLRLGSRGAVISIIIFLIVKIIANSKNKYRFFWAALLAIAGVTLMYMIDRYGIQFYQMLAANGRASRTLYLLLTGQMTSHDSGRVELWQMAIDAMRRKPVLGYGIGGIAAELRGHPYPHQLFIDLMCSFGIPIGAGLSVVVVIRTIRALLMPKGIQKDVMSIFMCIGLVSLMFSGTCFTNYYFFVFLGLSILRPSEVQE